MSLVSSDVKWHGRAAGNGEMWELTIVPRAEGFVLNIRYSGSCHENITGAGIWPTVEKAKEIAQTAAARLLDGAQVQWTRTE
jgi:hypothetical protein